MLLYTIASNLSIASFWGEWQNADYLKTVMEKAAYRYALYYSSLFT
jgi:hypothetical protein